MGTAWAAVGATDIGWVTCQMKPERLDEACCSFGNASEDRVRDRKTGICSWDVGALTFQTKEEKCGDYLPAACQPRHPADTSPRVCGPLLACTAMIPVLNSVVGNELPVACVLCQIMPAEMVVVACGHMDYCAACGGGPTGAIAANCGFCNADARDRVDVGTALSKNGAPARCFACREARAEVLLLPCAHMHHCKGCLDSGNLKGCPVCGQDVKEAVVVRWKDQVERQGKTVPEPETVSRPTTRSSLAEHWVEHEIRAPEAVRRASSRRAERLVNNPNSSAMESVYSSRGGALQDSKSDYRVWDAR